MKKHRKESRGKESPRKQKSSARGKSSQPRLKSPRPPPSQPKTPAPAFPVVGVGASAGGLEAFTHLLEHLPADAGMALVLVQHLDPHHASLLSGILSRAGSLPVTEAKDGMPVEGDHVYVIPPNASMALARGTLVLRPRAEG